MSEGEAKEYSISLETFQKSPEKITEHQDGDVITRENFNSFLIKSFWFSQGEPEYQYIYMDWLKNKAGFDWKKTFKNFMDAGGWECLSTEEKNIFKEKFKNITQHNQSDSVFYQTSQQYLLNKQLKYLTEPDDSKKELYSKSLVAFKSLGDTPKTEVDLVRRLKRL